jgi:hypothetical protein
MATVANEKTASGASASSSLQNKSSFLALTFGSVGVVHGAIDTQDL